MKFPTAGYYPLELVWRNRDAAGGLEISSRVGEWTTWTQGDFAVLGTDPAYAVYQRPTGVPSPAEAGANTIGGAVYTGTINPVADGLRVQQAYPTSHGGVAPTSVDSAISFFADKIIKNDDATAYNVGRVETRTNLGMTDPEGAGTGNFTDQPFPIDNRDANYNLVAAKGDDNFVSRLNGLVYIPAAGTYAVTSSTDDGFQLRVGNLQFGRRAAAGGTPAGTAYYMYGSFAQAGLYPFEYYQYEGTGGANIELAQGGSTSLVLASGSRNPASNGFTTDWTGGVYRVDPVASLRMDTSGLTLQAKAYGSVPALNMSVKPERWTLSQTVRNGPARTAGLLGTYYNFASTYDWNNPSLILGTRNDVQSGTFNFGDNYAYGPWGNTEDNFGAKWTGYVNIPRTGNYSFRMDSDDVSWIYLDIDGPLMPGGLTGAPTNGQWTVIWDNVFLTEGLHAVDFRAREYGGGENSVLQWMSDSFGWQQIPASYFSQNIFDQAVLAMATGTGAIGDLSSFGDLMTFPMDFQTWYKLRLSVDIAGLSAIYEGDFLFVPEPGTMVLLGGGLLALIRRRRARAAK
jgi:hypothetical protein